MNKTIKFFILSVCMPGTISCTAQTEPGVKSVALSGDAFKKAVLEERKPELPGEGTRRWDLIRSGTFSEKAIAVQQEMATLVSDLPSQG